MRVTYDRNKVFAIATGLLCALVFLAGTSLGAYHSLTELGLIAGLMSLACYLICDLALVVASVVDYAEDGNPLEWCAWLVKGFLSLYLLFSGGCIAYLLLEKAQTESALVSRVASSQKAFNDCLASAQTTKDKNRCNALARTIQETESANASAAKDERRASAGWIAAYVEWPLFKYLPGILGALCLFGLTLAAKLNGWFESRQGGSGAAPGNETARPVLPVIEAPALPLPAPVAASGRLSPEDAAILRARQSAEDARPVRPVVHWRGGRIVGDDDGGRSH